MVVSPVAWFTADQVVLTSGKVSQWTDRSGNGNHLTQSNASFRPTPIAEAVNGKSIIRFSTSYLTTAAFTAKAQPNTIWLVVKCTNQAALPTIVDGISAGHLHTIYCHTVGGAKVDIIGGTQLEGAAVLSTYATLVCTYNGNASKIRLNGSQVASGATGAQDLTGLTVGENFNISAAAFAGDIAEVGLRNGSLAASQLDQLEGYLRRRYATW